MIQGNLFALFRASGKTDTSPFEEEESIIRY